LQCPGPFIGPGLSFCLVSASKHLFIPHNAHECDAPASRATSFRAQDPSLVQTQIRYTDTTIRPELKSSIFELVFFFCEKTVFSAKNTSSNSIHEKPVFSRFQTPKGAKRGKKRAMKGQNRKKSKKKSKKTKKRLEKRRRQGKLGEER